MPMAADPLIESLLVLQERDVARDDLLKRLEETPQRIASHEAKIAAAEGELKKVLDEEKALQLASRDLEKRMHQAEESRAKFRTQQMLVKKNDEYAALEKQIEGAGAEIDSLETQTMEAMVKQDDFAAAVKAAREKCAQAVAVQKSGIESILRVKAAVEGEVSAANAAYTEARAKVPADAFATYSYVKTRVKRPPYIVPVEEMRCMGCHLKVSNDVLTQARVKGTLTRCDSCGRIVYMEH